MTDAAFAIAPMIPSPRQQSLTSSDQLGEAVGDDSAFSVAMQDHMATQSDAPSKPAAPTNVNASNGASQVATRPSSNAASGSAEGGDSESDSAPVADTGAPKSHKAEKSEKKPDGKQSDADKSETPQSDSASAPAAVAVPTTPIVETVKTAALADGTVKLEAAGKAGTVKPDKGSAALVSIASAAGDASTVADPSTAKPSADADAADAAKQGASVQAAQAKIMAQASTDSAAANRPGLKADAAVKGAGGAPVKNAKPGTTNLAAIAEPNAAADSAAAGPTSSKTGDASKQHRGGSTDISKDAAASVNANVLVGAAATAGGVSDSKPTDKSSPKQASDGNTKPGQSSAGAATLGAMSALGQNTPAGGALDAAAKPDQRTQPAVASPTQDKANAQPANNGPSAPVTHPADAAAAIKAAAQAMPPQPAAQIAPSQPAVPPLSDMQAQNPAFIAAHIVHTSDGSIPTPTIQAQMDGPRLTLPAEQLALQIHRHQMAGIDHFDIRIDPPDLGRIDVRLDMSSDGQTKAHVSADRQDTLNLLQRDSSHLERALNSNGLKTSLNFSLRQDGGAWNRGNGNWSGAGASPSGFWGGDEEIAATAAPVRARIIDPTRIDILI